MTIENLIKYIESEYGIKYDTPFKESDILIFRQKGNKKWFGALLKVSADKLGKEGKEILDILDVKTDPLIREPMLKKKGVYVAYHMNKVHWLTIVLNEVSDDDLKFLLDLSFNLTKAKRKK